MATTIELKNSVTTGNSPSSLAQGETGWNITDKKVWIGNASSTPIQIIGAGASMTLTSLTTNSDSTIHGLTVGLGGGSVTNNAAFGASSLTANTTGQYNTALGSQALQNVTTSNYDTGIGWAAAYAMLGNSNTAVGAGAMQGSGTTANNTGSSNSALGQGALSGLSSGSYNVAVGNAALQANTTASNNTAVGYQAGYTNTTGHDNAIFGYLAGYTNSAGSYNTLIGVQAGQNLNATSNTLIGQGAGYLITSGAKNSVLGSYSGNQGGLDIRTASNYIVLSDGDGNPRGIFDGSGNYMVGTTTANNNNTMSFAWNIANGNQYCNHISGTASGTGYIQFIYNGTGIGSITQSGTTAVLYNITSDQRLKENIINAPDASSDIDAIQVRSFDFISDKSAVKYGFIAQELLTIAPYAVHQPENPDEMMSVDYSKLVPMMLKEIQSLRARLKAANIA